MPSVFIQQYNTTDTIAAIASAQAVSAIGVIRISGNEAFAICNKIFKGKNLTLQPSHTIHYGYIVDENNNVVDEVMVSIFKAPKSFTTEDSVEISCHGSPFILSSVLQLLVNAGARLALAGEFSMRAFINGRIDLTQAEAVGDTIAAQNEAQLSIALQQMRGGLLNEISALRQQLLDFVSLIELELDFGEEDVEFADRTQFNLLIEKIIAHISPIIQSFKYGNAIKNGIPVAIIGRPNAGKSSLLNLLLNEERAIVSEIAGTTRDTIEEVLNINGIAYRFIDTAGIRNTEDTIEKIGIAKALKKVEEAQIVVYIFDCSATNFIEVQADLSMIKEKNEEAKILILANKTDLISNAELITIINQLKTLNNDAILPIQLTENTVLEIEKIKETLNNLFSKTDIKNNDTVITNLRHYTALSDAKIALENVQQHIVNQSTSDILALEVKKALHALGEISGEIHNDEVLGNIFGKFCIGK